MLTREEKQEVTESILNKIDIYDDCWVYDLYIRHGHPQHRMMLSNLRKIQLRVDTFLYFRFRKKLTNDCILTKICDTEHCVNPSHHISMTRSKRFFIENRDMMFDRAKAIGCDVMYVPKSGTYMLKPNGYNPKIHSGDDYCDMLAKATKPKINGHWYTGNNDTYSDFLLAIGRSK